AGYARDQATLDARTVDLAARETLPPHMLPRTRSPLLATAAAFVVVLASAGAWAWWKAPARAAHIARPTPTLVAKGPAAAPKPSARPVVPQLDGDLLDARIATAPSALPALLSAWQLPRADADVAIASACAPELAPGVACLRGRSTLDSLLAIGRPVLLRLRNQTHDTW